MPTRLADTRQQTLDDARATFTALARTEIEIARRAAQAEARIARLKAEHEAAVATLVQERDSLAGELSSYILGHPEEFTRPRAVKTDFGRFGRRDVSNVEILDSDRLIEWALLNGHDDVVRVVRSPVKPAIAARLRVGEDVPGAALRQGEEAFYSVDRALIDAAKEQ